MSIYKLDVATSHHSKTTISPFNQPVHFDIKVNSSSHNVSISHHNYTSPNSSTSLQTIKTVLRRQGVKIKPKIVHSLSSTILIRR